MIFLTHSCQQVSVHDENSAPDISKDDSKSRGEDLFSGSPGIYFWCSYSYLRTKKWAPVIQMLEKKHFKVYLSHFQTTYRVFQKKVRMFVFLISPKPINRFLTRFSLLKTEIHMQILNTEPFQDRDISKTKCGCETDQFIFIVSHSGLNNPKFAPSSANWPQTGPDSSQAAPSPPYIPN